MKKSKINILNALIADYPQFKPKSLLYDAIVLALGCTLAQAKELAHTHCNLVSLWAILRASEKYDQSYARFFEWMLKKDYCKKNGFILVDKKIILDNLKIESTLEYYEEYEDVLNPIRLNPDKFYQMKISADTSGWHFIACYVENNILYGSDSSYRGTPFVVKDKIGSDKFIWIQETC